MQTELLNPLQGFRFEKLLVAKLVMNLYLFVVSPASLLLSAFAKLRKATISLGVSVCPHGTSQLPLNGFS